jgi:hypothetical protein
MWFDRPKNTGVCNERTKPGLVETSFSSSSVNRAAKLVKMVWYDRSSLDLSRAVVIDGRKEWCHAL